MYSLIMNRLFKGIRYRSLDEARKVMADGLDSPPEQDIFDDDGEEPQGLLSIIPEDLLPEEDFLRLFGTKKGTLIEVEKIEYSGFGPPADEEYYMGFVSKECAYVVKGCHYPIEISDCPYQARDIHHLEAMVMDALHPLNSEDLAERLQLSLDWDFDQLFDLIAAGEITADEIDKLIHLGIQ
jgi:hypothetical protein